jgi:putative DNA primase/helicase
MTVSLEGSRRAPPHLTLIEARPPEFSEEQLALEFATLHADDLRYVAAWGQWFEWDGTRWKRDITLRIWDLARAVCRAASAKCNNPSWAKTIASARTVAAVERLARADRRLAATTEQWDSDPWLLNTPGGTVDLRAGHPREHRREDYCTKLTAVAPGGACPRFDEFLHRCTGGDRELVAFLRRVAGYALTGLTWEHALFFLHGDGGNGKRVLVGALGGVMGDYAQTAPIETFISGPFERHPTELARLQGARLVTASEAERDRPWNESRIKWLTGGDRITARFMQKDFFEYTPQFKLLIMGNHEPSLPGVNEAMRRRMNLVPFNVRLRPDEMDRRLPEKLQEEWPGILASMIEGCLEWQNEGLAPPAAVRDATEDYLSDEDSFGEWLGACCARDPAGFVASSKLYESWVKFARSRGEDPGKHKSFSAQMQARGFRLKRTNSVRGFAGLRLQSEKA